MLIFLFWVIYSLLRIEVNLPYRLPMRSIRPKRWMMTARVWVALLNYMMHSDAEIRHAPNQGAYLTPGEIGMDAGAVGLLRL